MTRMIWRLVILWLCLIFSLTSPHPSSAQPAVPQDYSLGPGDVLAVAFERNEDLNQSVTVRADGTITLPLVGTLRVAGMTVQQVEARLITLYARYLKNPRLTVSVVQPRKIRVAVIGQVASGGAFELLAGATVIDALAKAGGLSEAAAGGQAFLIRDGREVIALDLDQILKASGAGNIQLRDGDVIVVPRSAQILVIGDGVVRQGAVAARPGLTLLDVLLQSGGVTERVSLKDARLLRGRTQVVPVDWEALLLKADVTQDVPVLGGDIIVVPEDRNKDTQVFVMGMVRSPGAFPFRTVRTAYQALLAAGGPIENASLSNAYIVRRTPQAQGEAGMIKVDLAPAFLRGDVSKDIPLQAGDLLYVPEQAFSRWSRFLLNILSILTGLRIIP